MKDDRVRLGLVAVASPLEVGASEAPALLERLRAAFGEVGEGRLDVLPFPQAAMIPATAVAAGRFFYDQRVDALCVVAASWFEDYIVLDILEECTAPVIAWARPGMETGSLCGMQQLGFVLRALGYSYCVLFDHLESRPSLERAWRFALAASVRRQLRRARLGFMGHRVEGMTETTGHELALKKSFGVRIVHIDTGAFLERAARVPHEGPAARWAALVREVGRVQVSEEEGIASLRVYEALKAVIEEGGLSGVAIGCYPHLMGKVCLAASLLGEEGAPVGCEGDINGALGMLMLTRLTGRPVHNTDLLDPIPEHNSIVYSHCGSGGFSLAADRSQIVLAPVRLMNQGLCCLFTACPGPCTLINLVPTLDGYRLAALYGEALETTMVFPGNPLEVRFRSDYRDILAWIVDEGLGHHWMAAYGDLRPVLSDLCAMLGVEMLNKE